MGFTPTHPRRSHATKDAASTTETMAKHPELDITLLRSGPTDWDEADRVQGRTDLPLSAGAQASLEDVIADATAADGDKPRWVLAGPDEASVRIADALGAATGAKTRVVEGLAGVRCGLWEGRLRSELDERSPKAYRQWMHDPTSASPPEGETLEDATHRVLRALSRAADKISQGPVVVVARPLPLGLIRSVLEGLPLSSVWDTIDDTPRVWRTRVRRAVLRDYTHEHSAGA